MIDHRSMINQRIETPVGRQHGDRDSDESHGLASLSPPFLNGASTSTERADDLLPGELMVTDLIVDRELIPPFQSVVGQAS